MITRYRLQNSLLHLLNTEQRINLPFCFLEIIFINMSYYIWYSIMLILKQDGNTFISAFTYFEDTFKCNNLKLLLIWWVYRDKPCSDHITSSTWPRICYFTEGIWWLTQSVLMPSDNVVEVSTSHIYRLDLLFYWAVSGKLFQDRIPLLLNSLLLQVDT